MNLGWIWPRISDRASARNAIKGGFWACIFIVVVETAIGTYAIVTGQKFGGYYDARVLVDGALFAIIAWRLWRNSRAWAVIGLILMGLEIVDKIQNAASTFGVVTIFLFLAVLNATRGTFALRRYSEPEAPLVRARPRISMGWIWRMPDGASARKAVKVGCWTSVFLSMTYLLWAAYVLVSRQSLAGWEATEGWILALNGTFFVIVAWRLWKNSRAWALVGLVVMGAEFAGAQIRLGRPNGFVVVPGVLFLAMLNGTRGAFAFHRHEAQEASLIRAEQEHLTSLEPQKKA